MMRASARAVIAAAALAWPVPGLAQKAPEPPKPAEAGDPAIPPPTVSVTQHRGIFGGQTIAYRAVAGESYLKDKDGKPTAAIFSTAYIKEGAGDPTSRPVTFLFNGGPGSGSLWLHMGAFGPRRVVLPDAKDDGAPPYPVVDNPESLLDVTDIVFIDPVGTGFSRALGKTDPKDFYGVSKDARSIAQFIRQWLSENGRWNSPKYLGGESYGTTRSAAVLHELEGRYNDVALNGVILISTVLDFSLSADAPGNELSYVTTLPSMAAAALYHGKVADAPDVATFVEQVRQFAIGPYAAALLKGSRLGSDERAAVRRQLARFTGLSETFIDNADLRVSPQRFYKELLRDRGLTIGRLDARFTGRDYDRAGEAPDNDPSFYAIDGAYTAAANAYIRDTLKFSPPRDYVTIGGVGAWDWPLEGEQGRSGQVYVNVAPYIGEGLRENSGLRIFVGQGYYDFATPFFAAEYALSRTGIPADRIQFHYYGAGHMMYVRERDLSQLSSDIRAFIRAR